MGIGVAYDLYFALAIVLEAERKRLFETRCRLMKGEEGLMRLLAGLPVGSGESDFEGVTGRERDRARESRLRSQTARRVSSCEGWFIVNGEAYLSFTLPPTPAPLPWTINVASSKLQPAARTAEP